MLDATSFYYYHDPPVIATSDSDAPAATLELISQHRSNRLTLLTIWSHLRPNDESFSKFGTQYIFEGYSSPSALHRMASLPEPTVPVGPEPHSLQTTPSTQPRRALQREGARIFLSHAEQAIEDAMMRPSSPLERVLGKRARSRDDPPDGSDTEPDAESSSTTQTQLSSTSRSKVTTAALRYAMKKKLSPEQRSEVQAFLLDTELGRQTKLFEAILSLENKVDALRSAFPQPYQLSEELKTDINNYCVAVMLSVNIRAYKGNIPRNHVLACIRLIFQCSQLSFPQDILSKYHFELRVEHDHANYQKISTFVGNSVDQARTRLKKLIEESIKSNINIVPLVQMIVQSTPCRTTIQLCARVALMRAIYAECNGNEWFWNLIDARLDFIQSRAGASVSRLARAYKEILKADRARYGADEDCAIGDAIAGDWQQRVDDVVAGTAEVV